MILHSPPQLESNPSSLKPVICTERERDIHGATMVSGFSGKAFNPVYALCAVVFSVLCCIILLQPSQIISIVNVGVLR